MKSRASLGLLAGLTLVAFALRLAAAWGMDLWADDLGTIWAARDLTLRHPFTPSATEAHPPFSFLVAKLWFLLVGEPAPGHELVARLPFLVAGSLAVPLAYLVARRLLDRERWALGAAGFTAISPLLIWCDRDIRAYALLTPIALATIHAWLEARDEDRRAAWGRFVGFAALALWTHYNAIPLVAALLLVGLLESIHDGGTGWRKPFLAGAAILALIAPWLPAFWTHFTMVDLEAHRARVQLSIPPVALTAPCYVLFGMVLGHSVFPWNAVIAAPVAIACGVLGVSALGRAVACGCWRATLLGVVLPVVGAAATTFKMPRYYVAYVPLLFVFLLTGLERLEVRRRSLAIAATGVLLLGMLESDVSLLQGRELHFLYPSHPWSALRLKAENLSEPICARGETLFAQVYAPRPVLDPQVLTRPGGPERAFLLVDEAFTQEDEDSLLAAARQQGYRVISDEALLRDPGHDARERWIPRGKRAEPVRWLQLARD